MPAASFELLGALGLLGLFGSLGLRRSLAGFGAAAVDAVPAVGGCTDGAAFGAVAFGVCMAAAFFGGVHGRCDLRRFRCIGRLLSGVQGRSSASAAAFGRSAADEPFLLPQGSREFCAAVAASASAGFADAFAAAAGRFRKIITKYRPLKIFNIDFSAKSNGFR